MGLQGVKGGGCEAWTGEQPHCCIQTCVEAQKEGRLPSWAGGQRGEAVGEEALVGSGFLPGAFEASQISNTALATSLV